MNYPGAVCLMICSLAVLFAALALPYITSDLRESQRARIPLWAVFAAPALLLVAVLRLRTGNPSQFEIFNSVALTATMLGGVCLKWVMETIAQKKVTIHEPVLFSTLLVAPLAVGLSGPLFTAIFSPDAPVLWFLNGYFWHALFSDIERLLTKDRIIIRRREPPYPAPAALGPDKSVRA